MIIKVCGMRDADNIRAVSALGVDMIGLIFWPQSPRYVRMINSRSGIIPDKAGEGVVDDGLARPKLVGVFVDEMPQNIVTRVYNYTLDYVQLHGHESPTMIDNLRRTLDPDIRPGIKIIKAVSFWHFHNAVRSIVFLEGKQIPVFAVKPLFEIFCACQALPPVMLYFSSSIRIFCPIAEMTGTDTLLPAILYR